MAAQSIGTWLRLAQLKLAMTNNNTARLDCLVLIEDELGKDRSWILAHQDDMLDPKIVDTLGAKINRREKHVPLAYIRGKAEFYGRDFVVNEHTLVPRPETETMIDMLGYVSRLESNITTWEDEGRRRSSTRRQRHNILTPKSSLIHTNEGYEVIWEKPVRRNTKPRASSTERLSSNDQELLLADIGTGSGAIAVTAKLIVPDAQVIATDIDKKCLETAQMNAEKLGAAITCLHGNLLEPIEYLPTSANTLILLCNLPYVPENFQINTAATHEPRHALFGGPDGLDLYRELFSQIKNLQAAPRYILTESLPPQHEELTRIAKAAGFTLTKTDDFIQLFEKLA